MKTYRLSRLTILWLSLLVCLLNTGVSHAVPSLPSDHPTYRTIRTVYDRIAKAFGDGRVPPKLLVIPKNANQAIKVALYLPGSEGAIGSDEELAESVICIDEQLFELLGALGKNRDNGLAVIIGHELAHFYYRHGWVGEFGNAFADTGMGRSMLRSAAYDEVIRIETEADYFGGFYGYLAGYNTLGLAPQVLELIYRSYGIPDSLKSYPSLQERKAIAQKSEEQLRKMLPVFEAATRLLLVGQYEETGRLYRHIARTFPSREMFNNAGVATALKALEQSPESGRRLLFPFEIDTETRLHMVTRQAEFSMKRSEGFTKGAVVPFGVDDTRDRLLREAEKDFREAIARDAAYGVAHVNLAAVLHLLGDRIQAQASLERGLALAARQQDALTQAWGRMVQGIMLAESGKRDKALAIFKELAPRFRMARENLERLQAGRKPPKVMGDEPPPLPRRFEEERIGGLSGRDREAALAQPDSVISIKGLNQPTIEIRTKQTERYQAQFVRLGSREAHLFLATPAAYNGVSSGGIVVGNPVGRVIERYGAPNRIIGGAQGEFLHYRRPGILFDTGLPTGGGAMIVRGWLLHTLWQE